MSQSFDFNDRILKVKVKKRCDENGNIEYEYLTLRKEPRGRIKTNDST